MPDDENGMAKGDGLALRHVRRNSLHRRQGEHQRDEHRFHSKPSRLAANLLRLASNVDGRIRVPVKHTCLAQLPPA
jgi:hypothetical protein